MAASDLGAGPSLPLLEVPLRPTSPGAGPAEGRAHRSVLMLADSVGEHLREHQVEHAARGACTRPRPAPSTRTVAGNDSVVPSSRFASTVTVLARHDVSGEAAHRVRLGAGESRATPAVSPVGELQRQRRPCPTRFDRWIRSKLSAMHEPDAQQHRALRRPVAARPAAVLLAGDHARAARPRPGTARRRRRSTAPRRRAGGSSTSPSVPGASSLRSRMFANVPRIITSWLPRREP